jgi:hypothetical protein
MFQGQSGGGFDPNLFAQAVDALSKIKGIQDPTAKLNDIYGQMGDVRGQLKTLNEPGQLPKMGPEIDRSKGFLHNLGQALMMGAEAFGPGRSIVQGAYQPGIESWTAKRADLLQQLKDLQDAAGIPEKELQTTGQLAQDAGLMGIRQSLAESRATSAQAALSRAQTAKMGEQEVERHHQEVEDIDRMNIDVREKGQRLAAVYHNAQIAMEGRAISEHWDQAELENQRSLLEDYFNRQSQLITNNPLKAFMGWLPDLPSSVPGVTPQGTPPSRTAQPGAGAGVSAKPIPRPSGATHTVPGSDGNTHWTDGKKDLGIAKLGTAAH